MKIANGSSVGGENLGLANKNEEDKVSNNEEKLGVEEE